MMLPRSPRPAQRALLEDVVGAARMHEDGDAELRGLRPERVVLRQREILAVDVSADRRPAQAEPLDAVLELLRRQIGMLQASSTPSRRTDAGCADDPLREPFVLCLDDRARRGRDRSTPYHQKPLMLSAWMSMPCLVDELRGAAARATWFPPPPALFLERRALDDVRSRRSRSGSGCR